MKSLNKYIIVFFLFGCNFNAKSNNQKIAAENKNVTNQLIVIKGICWDRENSAIVAIDSTNMVNAIIKSGIYDGKSYIDEFVSSIDIVDSNAVAYLHQYIENSCNKDYPAQKDLEELYDFYIVSFVDGKTVQNCYFYTKNVELVKSYFEDMIVWIKKSSYQNQFRNLLKYIELQVENCNRISNYINKNKINK